MILSCEYHRLAQKLGDTSPLFYSHPEKHKLLAGFQQHLYEIIDALSSGYKYINFLRKRFSNMAKQTESKVSAIILELISKIFDDYISKEEKEQTEYSKLLNKVTNFDDNRFLCHAFFYFF